MRWVREELSESDGSESQTRSVAMTSGSHEQQNDGAQVAGDWTTLSDELLQGLVHALNNRVAAKKSRARGVAMYAT